MPYIQDATNFQPDITPRNAIRQKLEKLEENGTSNLGTSLDATLPKASLLVAASAPSGLEQVGDAYLLKRNVQILARQVEDIERKGLFFYVLAVLSTYDN